MTDYVRPSFLDLKNRIAVDLAAMPGVLREPLSVALARGHHSAHGHLEWADKQSSPLTCEEERLADWAALYNVKRLMATFATGPALCSGTIGATVLKSAQARGPNGLDYEVLVAVGLGAGQTPVSIRCLTSGPAGNLTAGQTLTIIDPLPGVSSSMTVGDVGITGGADQETVDAWRVRVADEWQTVVSQGARGGKPDDYRFWARSAHPSVTGALVQTHTLGLGTVVVRPICNDLPNRLPTAAIIDAVKAYFETTVIATADWRVELPINRAVVIGIDLAPLADTAPNRSNITTALNAAVMAESSETSVIQMAEVDAAIATVTTQYTRLYPTADIVVGPGEVFVLAPIEWAP